MLTTNPLRNLGTGLFSVLVVMGLTTATMTNTSYAEADQAEKTAARTARPTIIIEKPGKCVEDTDLMRRDHMKYILHQRDRTVHLGIRTEKHSLKNCVNCHASSKTNSVLGKDGFCASCHAYASVSMDCFSCHASSPEKNATVRTDAVARDEKLPGRVIPSNPILHHEPAFAGKTP